MVQLALRDLQKRRHWAEVQAFIESEGFEVFCDWLGWDITTLRQAVASGWRLRDV